MTGAEVAAVIGGVLAEWRHTGWLPPRACGEPYPLMPEFRCTHPPHGRERLHGYDGPFPPEENR